MAELLKSIYETTLSLRDQQGNDDRKKAKRKVESEKNTLARQARQNEWIAAGGTLYRMASILKKPGQDMLRKVLFDKEVITHVIQDIRIRNLWLSGATGKERKRESKQTDKTLTMTINDDQFMDIIFMIWLDGVHDEYVKQTFFQWTQGAFFKKYFANKEIKKIVNTWFNLEQKGTNFMKALFKSMESKPTESKRFENNTLSLSKDTAAFGKPQKGWEALIKWDIGNIFKYKNQRKLKRNQFLSKGTKQTNTKVPVLYVSVDAEERDDKPLSMLVDNSRKVMNNLVTPGTLLDPGNTMILGGINTDIGQMVEHHFGAGGSFNLRNSYYIAPMTLDMQLTGEISVFKLELKINNGMAQSGEGHTIGSFFEQRLNGVLIPNVPSAKIEAQRNPNNYYAAASKWSGDGLQYIYQAFIDTVNPNPGAVRYPFGSQDGMADCCFCKWSELLGNKSPIVFVDWGLSTGKSGSMVIQAYNLPETLKIRQLVASEISLRGPETIQGTPVLWTPVASVAGREKKNSERLLSRLKDAYGNNKSAHAEIDEIFDASEFLTPLSMDYKKLLHRLKTLDGQSFQENNVGEKKYIREIFDEFKSKFDDYIFVDNNELMAKINSKISNLTNTLTKAETNLNRATFQNYNSLINRISRKLVMNGAKKAQVVAMAAQAKEARLTKENKQEILNSLKTTNNTEGVKEVSNRITQMLKSPQPAGGYATLSMSQVTLNAKGNANSGGNANSNGGANSKNKWGRSPAQVARNRAGAAAMETAMNKKGFLNQDTAAVAAAAAAAAEKNAGNQQRGPKRQRR